MASGHYFQQWFYNKFSNQSTKLYKYWYVICKKKRTSKPSICPLLYVLSIYNFLQSKTNTDLETISWSNPELTLVLKNFLICSAEKYK